VEEEKEQRKEEGKRSDVLWLACLIRSHRPVFDPSITDFKRSESDGGYSSAIKMPAMKSSCNFNSLGKRCFTVILTGQCLVYTYFTA